MCIYIFQFNCQKQCTIWHRSNVQLNRRRKKREIEKIEEGNLRSIFKTDTGIQVPIHLMYLDGGQVPARYQIKRYMVNFLHYILQQEDNSLLNLMFRAQEKSPTKGDWVSETKKN